jgi:hypothetical protein
MYTANKIIGGFAMREELAALIARDGRYIWEKYDYNFNFKTGKFLWRGEAVYITAGEALYLYRRLGLKDEAYKEQRYYLRNMRRRLGERGHKKFLEEVTK